MLNLGIMYFPSALSPRHSPRADPPPSYDADPDAIPLYMESYKSSDWEADWDKLQQTFKHIEQMYGGCPASWFFGDRHEPGSLVHHPFDCPFFQDKRLLRQFHDAQATGSKYCYSCRVPDRWFRGSSWHVPDKSRDKDKCGPHTQYIRILLILLWTWERPLVLAAMQVIGDHKGVDDLEKFASWGMGRTKHRKQDGIQRAIILLARVLPYE
jgi:hypothetical protein